MDESAIKRIQDTAILAHQSTVSDLAFMPTSATAVDLEKYRGGRRRFRGRMHTTSLNSFAEYVKKSTDPPVCFIDPEDMVATAYFNYGSRTEPGHCDDTADLCLEKTAVMKAMLEINGKRLTQKEIAEWMEDWRLFLSALDADSKVTSLVKAIAAVRDITIESSRKSDHKESDFKEHSSLMESIEARSKAGLPSFIQVNCEPYVGLLQRLFEMRLSVITGGDKPQLVLRATGLELHREEMAKEFEEKIRGELASIDVYQGTFKP